MYLFTYEPLFITNNEDIYEGNILYLHSKVIYTSIYLRNVINGTE